MKNLALLFLMLCPLVLLPPGAHAVPSGKIIAWEGGGQGRVIFEGEEHAEHGYRCDVCHPSLFPMKKGPERMTMEEMNKGRFCGACHDGKTAFGTKDPKKCHECHKAGKDGKERHHEDEGSEKRHHKEDDH